MVSGRAWRTWARDFWLRFGRGPLFFSLVGLVFFLWKRKVPSLLLPGFVCVSNRQGGPARNNGE